VFHQQICTALIWLLYKTSLCNEGGNNVCSWGNAAVGNLIAQILYVVAAIFHDCASTPREEAARREVEAANKRAEEAERRAAEAEAKLVQAEGGRLGAITEEQPMELVTGVE